MKLIFNIGWHFEKKLYQIAAFKLDESRDPKTGRVQALPSAHHTWATVCKTYIHDQKFQEFTNMIYKDNIKNILKL